MSVNITGDVSQVLRDWHRAGRISAPGAPSIKACSPITPGLWYRTISWDQSAGSWLVVDEDPWSVADRRKLIRESHVMNIGVIDVLDHGTCGALLGLFQEYDGPLASVEFSSAGTELGVVWKLMSHDRCCVSTGATQGIAIARGICGLQGWGAAEVAEFKRSARARVGPDGMWVFG